jgi:pseudaminic acid biosynthesis-associated methylase
MTRGPERTERTAPPEATRLESLWAGEFGDAYVARNAVLDERRAAFWRSLLASAPIETVLEVGCGQGGNLRPIASILEPPDVWGIDVNAEAIERSRRNAPGTNAVHSVARNLPFRDDWFDLVFTVGVLIHQPEDSLHGVMAEIVRCARRFVLWGEYRSEQTEEVPYRGASGALFKRDYGQIYAALFPRLTVRAEGFLGPEEGFDQVTWQLLEKPAD